MAKTDSKIWKYIFWALAVILIVLVILYFATRKQDDKGKEMCPDGKTPVPKSGECPKESIPENPVPDETGCIQPSRYEIYQYPISFGMKDGGQGIAVSELQHKMNIRYNAGLKEDGFFGCRTRAAALKYLGTDKIYTNNPIWNTPEPMLG